MSIFLAFFFAFCGHLSGGGRNLEPLQIRKLVCERIESLKLKIEIPFNGESEVWLPNNGRSSITESAKDSVSKKEITLLRKEGDFNAYRIGSGIYSFEIKYPAEKF